jgi:hypothetical protein
MVDVYEEAAEIEDVGKLPAPVGPTEVVRL